MADEFTGKPIKVHFASAENAYTYSPARKLSGSRYCLGSAYIFVAPHIGRKAMKSFFAPAGADITGDFIASINEAEHAIIDSGLFTLLFGTGKEQVTDERAIRSYADALINFYGHAAGCERVSCVEVDCQKLCGPDLAWELRRHMRDQLPGHDILNVYHLEDGEYGLDKLIEFSDYLCLSIPELRKSIPSSHLKKSILGLLRHIHARRPRLRVHLLGCTEIGILKAANGLAYSADSISWLAPVAFHPPGKGRDSMMAWKPTEMDFERYLADIPGVELWPFGRKCTVLKWAAAMCVQRRRMHTVLGPSSC